MKVPGTVSGSVTQVERAVPRQLVKMPGLVVSRGGCGGMLEEIIDAQVAV
jgi:hypothetical protein